jgi:hypothetical protein
MKVEFSLEEVRTMAEAIVDEILELPLNKRDQASLRRWSASHLEAGAPGMQALVKRINEDLQREHARAEVTPIQKPDWA